MQVDVGYPSADAEREVLLATTGVSEVAAEQVLTADDLISAQKLVRQIPVGDSVVQAILDLVRAGRPDETSMPEIRETVAWGPGPRASQALMLATRARALLDGRYAPSVDDVLSLAKPVLRHRMALNFAARADGVTLDEVIGRLLRSFGLSMAGRTQSRAANLATVRQRAEETAARLPALLVAADRVAATVAQGVHGRRRVGQGETFWQFRQYQQGDPVARIDWRQSAKRDNIFIRRKTSGQRRRAFGCGSTSPPQCRTGPKTPCRKRPTGPRC